MKALLFVIVTHILLVSNQSYAFPIDLFVRAQAVKNGVVLDQPHYKVGDIVIEKGNGGDWRTTFVSKVTSVNQNEVSFVESKVDSGVNAVKSTYTVNLNTGLVTKFNGEPNTELTDWEIQVKEIKKQTLSTQFGAKTCSILTIQLHQLSNGYRQNDVVYAFCNSMPGSGVLYNSWNVLSLGRELKDYLD